MIKIAVVTVALTSGLTLPVLAQQNGPENGSGPQPSPAVGPAATNAPATPAVAPTPDAIPARSAPAQPVQPQQTSAPPMSARPTTSPMLDRINNAQLTDKPAEKGGANPAIIKAEVLLDRVHDSPGVIDGKDGENFVHALEAFEAKRHLGSSKTLDERVWSALLAEGGPAVMQTHALTDEDVAGPFFPDLPKDYSKLAELKTIGYRSPAQKIGAKFHMSEDLLSALNPGVDLGKAGSQILVTNVAEAPIHDKINRIIVDKSKSQVFAYDERDHVVMAVPATIGSEELPSPSGTYKVKGISWNPIYYYNPKNFVQGHNKENLRLPPGPNNPVGSVFIALTKPTYGLHGTPDPSKIDKSASHGCVRMTNWDATALAHLVADSKNHVIVSFTGSRDRS